MIKNKIEIVLFTLLCVGLFSCSNDEDYDFPGTSENLVYMKPSSNTVNSFDLAKFQVYHTPVSSQSNLNIKLPVFATIKASGNISVQVAINNSLVDTYNAEHSTEYKKVPDNLVVFKNEILTIPSGDMISKDSVSVSLNNDNLKSLEVGNYIIPIIIKSVNGAKASSNRNRTFLLVNVSEDNDNIWDGGTPIGTLMKTNRPTWTLAFTPNYSESGGEISKIFDGNIGGGWDDSWYCNLKQNTAVVIDMQTVQNNITGLYINEMVNNSTLFYSSDNNRWISLGSISGDNSDIVFYAPITARYIKWEVPVRNGSWGMYLNLYEISIYQK